MKRRAFVRQQAQTDIREAARWYEGRESGLGIRFVAQLHTMLQQISENPLRFPIVSENVRRALLQRFPYSVYFINQEDSVAIIAVLHQHRRPDMWQAQR